MSKVGEVIFDFRKRKTSKKFALDQAEKDSIYRGVNEDYDEGADARFMVHVALQILASGCLIASFVFLIEGITSYSLKLKENIVRNVLPEDCHRENYFYPQELVISRSEISVPNFLMP